MVDTATGLISVMEDGVTLALAGKGEPFRTRKENLVRAAPAPGITTAAGDTARHGGPMTTVSSNHFLTYQHCLALRQERGGITDDQLLERFLARREDLAFEELVRRHTAARSSAKRAALDPTWKTTGVSAYYLCP